jgi:molecular chaperone GrpE (heat shock protein)
MPQALRQSNADLGTDNFDSSPVEVDKVATDDITVENEGRDRLPPGDDLSCIGLRLAALQETLTALRELFEHRIQYDEAKERAFDILHEKMRQSETDHESSLKKGLVLSLLLLHDRMQKAESELIETATARRINDFRTQLLDILYAEGVEPIETVTEVFDRSRQQAIGSVATTDPIGDNTVERIVREGFLSSGKVLRPQSVIVRRYQARAMQEKTTAKGEQ